MLLQARPQHSWLLPYTGCQCGACRRAMCGFTQNEGRLCLASAPVVCPACSLRLLPSELTTRTYLSRQPVWQQPAPTTTSMLTPFYRGCCTVMSRPGPSTARPTMPQAPRPQLPTEPWSPAGTWRPRNLLGMLPGVFDSLLSLLPGGSGLV